MPMKNKEPKPKREPLTKKRKRLDKLFSQFIRMRDADEYGMVKCYTCPKTDHWKKMQCGHFVPRQYLATRFDEMNCHSQCYACNMLYNGQPSAYARLLEREYGKGTVELLESRRTKVIKEFPYDFLETIYKEQLEILSHRF